MICKECQAEKLKSKVYCEGTTTTLLQVITFFDEDGKEHSHDANTYLTTYKCSNGHKMEIKLTNKCWCGWPDDKKI